MRCLRLGQKQNKQKTQLQDATEDLSELVPSVARSVRPRSSKKSWQNGAETCNAPRWSSGKASSTPQASGWRVGDGSGRNWKWIDDV